MWAETKLTRGTGKRKKYANNKEVFFLLIDRRRLKNSQKKDDKGSLIKERPIHFDTKKMVDALFYDAKQTAAENQ